MALALGEGGYTVTAVGSLADAEARLGAGRPPEVMVLDVRLHEDSGVDLVRKLAAEGHLPTTIVVSGAATIVETVEALRLGVFDFIEKPASRERLLQSVANALEQRRLRRQVRGRGTPPRSRPRAVRGLCGHARAAAGGGPSCGD